jgi:hypothetical protein
VTNTIVITVSVTDTPTGTASLADADTPTPTATPESTKPKPTTSVSKPAATNAPLSINYEVLSTKRNPGNQAVLTLHVIATGGSGSYQYYGGGNI